MKGRKMWNRIFFMKSKLFIKGNFSYICNTNEDWRSGIKCIFSAESALDVICCL